MKATIIKKSKNYSYPMVEIENEFIEINGVKTPKILPCKYFGNYRLNTLLEGNIVTIPRYIINGEDEIGKIRNFNDKLLSRREILSSETPISSEGVMEVFWPNSIPNL